MYSETAAYGHMGRTNKIVEKEFTSPDGKVIKKSGIVYLGETGCRERGKESFWFEIDQYQFLKGVDRIRSVNPFVIAARSCSLRKHQGTVINTKSPVMLTMPLLAGSAKPFPPVSR